MRHRNILVSLTALAFTCAFLVFPGCGEAPSSGVGAPCDADADCDPGLACNSLGQCITVQCTTNADCEQGYRCNSLRACERIPDENPGGCRSDTDCPTGYVCSTGRYCVQDSSYCFTTDDCPIGYYCDRYNSCKPRNTADVDINDGDLDSDGDEPDGDEEPIDGDGEEAAPDRDGDGLPDHIEDRNGNGIWEPDLGETDPDNPDTDNDGLLDGVEDANKDGIRQLNETDPLNPDSDYDKLLDGQEDTNGNGIWEPELGETDPRNPDTDNDGVIDGNELAGTYSNGNSSNPLAKDTDGDGLPDGVEDANGNGIYEPELGETDPTLVDSDNDGIPDNEESVTQICLPDQVTVVTLHDSPGGDWTLALLPDFSYVHLNLAPQGSERLAAAAFEDPTNEIAGFVVSRTPAAATVMDQVGADNALLLPVPSDNNLNHRGRSYTTADDFPSLTSNYSLRTATRSVGSLRNALLAALTGRDLSGVDNLPDGPSESSDRFEVRSQTLLRSGNVITLMVVVTKSRYDNASTPQARIRVTDLTDGTALAKSQKGTDNDCNPFRGKTPAVTDILWVVDKSGSMSQDQQAVADAASLFGTIMTRAGVDFRVAVTSTGCRDAGTLGTNKFTSNVTGFQNDVRNPPCGSSEYGLRSGWSALDKAQNSTLPENERWRAGASKIVVFLSDEEDQEYEDCGSSSCRDEVLVRYKNFYSSVNATCYAIVGDIPSGCGGGSASSGQGSGEAGTAYVEIAYHTGGTFGSICSPDLTPTMEEILRGAAGTASTYELVQQPITSTLQVMIEGSLIPRDPSNGFEYDGGSNTIVFYGTERPEDGNDVVISYRYFKLDPKPGR